MTRRRLDVPRSFLAVLLAAGLVGCGEAVPPPPRETPEFQPPAAVKNPPPAQGGMVLRSGETSAGRSFYVLGESTQFEVKLLIAGEQVVSFGGCGYWVNVGSIAVDELPGTPALVHVRWTCDWMYPVVEEFHGNLVFARGAAETILLSDCSWKAGGDSWGCDRRKGRYAVAYADGVVSVVEGYTDTNAYCIWGTSDCGAGETQMTRRWEVSSSGLTLLTCEKLQRSVSPPLVPEGCGDVYGLLAVAPWQPQAMSPEESAQRCRTSFGGL